MKKFVLLLGLAALFSLSPAYAAKIKPAYDIQTLPQHEDEAQLWERATNHETRLRDAGTIFPNRPMEEYIEALAARMLGDSIDHLGVKIKFVLVEEPTLSAWAYPYGTIGLHTGLLVRMDNEAQFGAILAHELSHFLQRHTYREMLDGDKQSTLGKGFGLLAGLAVAKETGTFDKGVMDFTGDLWENLATSGYSKKNEYVADEEGLTLMARANLSIDEAIPAFQALAENEAYGAGDPRKMWSSHPRLESRIKNLNKEIRKAKKKREYVAGAASNPADYYRGIAPALVMNAKLDIKERQFQRALDALNKYLMVHGDNPEAHYLVGEAHRKSNPQGPDFVASEAAYRRALEHDSTYGPALKELGMAYRLQHRNSEAKSAFESYLTHAPDAADAGIIRGYLEGLQ